LSQRLRPCMGLRMQIASTLVHSSFRRVRILRVALVAGAVALTMALPARAADVVYPVGTRVGLVPAPGLVVARGFPGLEDADRAVRVVISELPENAFFEIENTVFNGGLAKEIVLDKREMISFAGSFGILVTGHQEIDGTRVRKWLMFGSAPGFTALVSVQLPEAAAATYPDGAVRTMLESVVYRDPPIQEQLGLLPFRLGDLAGFRIVRAMPAGAIMLTEGPQDDDASDQPYLIVSLAPGGPQEPSDRETFARRLLTSIPTLVDTRVVMREAMRIGGQPGMEIRVEGRDARTGEAVMLVQWVRFGTGAFTRVVGITRKDKWADIFPRFRAVRDGVELK
jgi:hypothetical protein